MFHHVENLIIASLFAIMAWGAFGTIVVQHLVTEESEKVQIAILAENQL